MDPFKKLKVCGAHPPVSQPSGTTMDGFTDTLFSSVAVAVHVGEEKVNAYVATDW